MDIFGRGWIIYWGKVGVNQSALIQNLDDYQHPYTTQMPEAAHKLIEGVELEDESD